jgi:sporulation protein YlmC with PRC-barrel domain
MSDARRSLDLLREVLDHELVDVDGVSCGMVDDIEFTMTPRGPAVAALLVGPGAWGPRLPALLAWAARRCFGTQRQRVPWSDVADVSEVIRLRCRASERQLGVIDRKVGRWLARLPKS